MNLCVSGYYCVPELVTPGDPASTRHVCPLGSFCPNATGHDLQPCPAGSYGNRTGLTAAADCVPCDAGSYCAGTNLTRPTDTCWAGYYCVSGVNKPNPLMLNDTQCPLGTVHPIIGHSCPAGHYCLAGAVLPRACPAGMYQDLTAQSTCKNCPAGYYCHANTTDYSTNICPAGYYCEANTPHAYSTPCPPGTFNNLTGQHGVSACIPCTPGSYCQGAGNSAPTGTCFAGWYCSGNSSEPMVSKRHVTYF